MNDEAIQSVMDSLRRVVRCLRKASRQSEQNIGLRAAQVFVLQQLSKFAPLSMNELAERTYSHQSTVSVVVDELVRMRLVDRSTASHDRRRVVLNLTKAGRSRIVNRHPIVQEKMIQALGRMPVAKQKSLAKLLKEFIAHTSVAYESPQFFFENEDRPRRQPSKRKRSRK
jgi:DNA-binding MarR family transcriptional regulator